MGHRKGNRTVSLGTTGRGARPNFQVNKADGTVDCRYDGKNYKPFHENEDVTFAPENLTQPYTYEEVLSRSLGR